MALSQESIFSVIYTLKHNPYQHWIENWDVNGPMLLRWLGSSVANFLTFQWVGWLIHLPVVRPDALASIFHEYNFPPTTQYSTSLANVPGMMTINNVIPTTVGNNQFVLGLMNSPALVVSISTTTVFCFRWLCIDIFRFGAILAFFGNFLGNWLVIVAVLFGLDDILAHWYFLTPLTYVGGILFIWRLVWRCIREGRQKVEALLPGPFGMDHFVWRGITMAFTGFALGLTEQTVLFQKLIQPLSPEQIHLLHGFSSGTVRDHILMHGSYVLGLFVGGFLLGSFILALLVPFADYLLQNGWVSDAKLLLLLVIMTGTSLPYYGLDYVLTRFADFSRDGGWQNNTIFRTTIVKGSRKHGPIVEISRRDEARPWLEARYLYPERKWWLKVSKVNDKPLFSLKAALDASKMTGHILAQPWRSQWKNMMAEYDPNATLAAMQEGWDLIGHHFYKWTEEELFRRDFQTAMKTELQKTRYRILRIRNLYDSIYVMNNDQLTVKDIEFGYEAPVEPPSNIDTPFAAHDFVEGVDEYFDWVLVGTPEYEAQRDALLKESQAQIAQKLKGKPLAAEQNVIRQDSDDSLEEEIKQLPVQETTQPTKAAATIQTFRKTLRNRFLWVRQSDLIKEARKWGYQYKFAANQYRHQVEEELYRGWTYMHARFWKGTAYSHFMFRRLLELEIDSLVARQPSRNFVTDSEYKRLQYHQVALAAYHRGLRSYEDSLASAILDQRGNRFGDETWRSEPWGNWKRGWRAKSLENYVYAQQFKGTQRVIQRLFFLDVSWNPWEGKMFRYDQLLPLEEQDKGDRSNLWHEEIPRSLREEVGAYDPFQSKRVAPMFDPVPFYIGWDPVMRKSVLTTSRMPIGSTRVKLTLPIVSKLTKWDKWDFLGIKRFLEETKLYEYVDFVADEDHEFFVYVKDKPDKDLATENFKKAKKDRKTQIELEVHQEPSSIRISPRYKRIMPGWKFSKRASAPYRFELQQRLQQMAAEAEEAEDEESKRISPNLIKGLKQRLLLENKAADSLRQVRQLKKPLVTERPFVEVRSPMTWFSAVPEAKTSGVDFTTAKSTDQSDSDDSKSKSSDDSDDD